MKSAFLLLLLASPLQKTTGLPEVGEAIVITDPSAWRSTIQDPVTTKYKATGLADFISRARWGDEATVVAVQMSGDKPSDPIDIVVRFKDNELAITTGTVEKVPAFLLVGRGFERREWARHEAENAKKARAAKYANVRIWLDTVTEVVRAGSTGSWYASCKDDRIDDQRICTVTPIGVNRVSLVVRKAGTLFDIGGRNYPGSGVAIRIDKAPPIKWAESDRLVASPITLSQMITGKHYLVRYYGWPNRDEQIDEGSLDGFKEVYQWALQAVKVYPAKTVAPDVKLDSGGETPAGVSLRP